MPTPAAAQDRKRQRASAAVSSDEDSDAERLNTDSRPCQAERKRELERNRRNLINVRFSELDIELRRSAPILDATSAPLTEVPAAKVKRIDKEAVLKEATQRLSLQRKELERAMERAKATMVEMENLRAEKVELRNDKSYLRSELSTVRGDIQRLRTDNLNLWQAVKKSTMLKTHLAPDVVKVPADLFSRSYMKPGTQSSMPFAATNTAAVAGTTASVQQTVPPPSAAVTEGGPPNSKKVSEGHDGTSILSSDNPYLMYQSTEDIGDLFATYVPGSATPIVPREVLASDAEAHVNFQSINVPRPSSTQPTATQSSPLPATPSSTQPLQLGLVNPIQTSQQMTHVSGGPDLAVEPALAFSSPMMSPQLLQHHAQFGRGEMLAASIWFGEARDGEPDRVASEIASAAQTETAKADNDDMLPDIAPCV